MKHLIHSIFLLVVLLKTITSNITNEMDNNSNNKLLSDSISGKNNNNFNLYNLNNKINEYNYDDVDLNFLSKNVTNIQKLNGNNLESKTVNRRTLNDIENTNILIQNTGILVKSSPENELLYNKYGVKIDSINDNNVKYYFDYRQINDCNLKTVKDLNMNKDKDKNNNDNDNNNDNINSSDNQDNLIIMIQPKNKIVDMLMGLKNNGLLSIQVAKSEIKMGNFIQNCLNRKKEFTKEANTTISNIENLDKLIENLDLQKSNLVEYKRELSKYFEFIKTEESFLGENDKLSTLEKNKISTLSSLLSSSQLQIKKLKEKDLKSKVDEIKLKELIDAINRKIKDEESSISELKLKIDENNDYNKLAKEKELSNLRIHEKTKEMINDNKKDIIKNNEEKKNINEKIEKTVLIKNDLDEKIATINKIVEKSKNEINTKSNEINKKKSQIEEKKDRINVIIKEINKLIEEKSKLAISINNLYDEIQVDSNEYMAILKNDSLINIDKMMLKNNMTNIEKEEKNLQDKLSLVEQNIEFLNQNIENLTKEGKNINNQSSNYKNGLSIKKEDSKLNFDDLNASFINKKEILENLNKERITTELNLNNIELERKNVKSKIKTLKLSYENYKKEIFKFEELRNLKNDKMKYLDARSFTKMINEEDSEKIKILQNKIINIENKIKEEKKICEDIKNSIFDNIKKFRDLNNEHLDSENNILTVDKNGQFVLKNYSDLAIRIYNDEIGKILKEEINCLKKDYEYRSNENNRYDNDKFEHNSMSETKKVLNKLKMLYYNI